MKEKSNLLIVGALLLLVVFSFGYVSYSTTNLQNSTSKEVAKWDVSITNVEILTNGDAEDTNYEYKEGTIVLRPTLRTLDDSIVYRVTIKNKGTLPATIGRYIYNEKNKDNHIIFDHNEPKEDLAPNEESTIELYVHLNEENFEEGNVYTNDLTAIYEYIQK